MLSEPSGRRERVALRRGQLDPLPRVDLRQRPRGVGHDPVDHTDARNGYWARKGCGRRWAGVARPGGRRSGASKGAKSKARAARRRLTVKGKTHFLFAHRHLIVKRRENRTNKERDDLTRMLKYLPELATSRRLADWIYSLLDTPNDVQRAGCRRSAILRDPAFQTVPELVKAMEQLDAEEFLDADGIPEESAPLRRPVTGNLPKL